MEPVGGWTGRSSCELQTALRLSNEAFAAALGVGVRTVAAWHQKPALRPRTEMQQLLDTALQQATPAEKERFAKLTDTTGRAGSPTRDSAQRHAGRAVDTERRLAADRHIAAALEWLDQSAGWEQGRSRREVAAQLEALDMQDLVERGQQRATVDQRTVATALGEIYGTGDHAYYCARYDDREAVTSIHTRPEWLDLDCPLLAGHDKLTLARNEPRAPDLGQVGVERAVQRLAETLALGVRVVDLPLYRLRSISPERGAISATVDLAPFVEYVLTLDLLEGELVDALTSGNAAPTSLPLRQRYLPDLEAVLDLPNRLCVGGALALCVIARPANPYRGTAEDYLLLVQERSGHVINTARRLAVIPKGFHQPMVDFQAETHIGPPCCGRWKRSSSAARTSTPRSPISGAPTRCTPPVYPNR